ncbi:MAG: DUF4167 domain-containing protein [Albidovulum sp.]
MRSSKSRSRSKSNRQRSLGNIINRVFDSSGPEGKVRGTPQQIIDKYLMLARDAQLSNDRVAEQAFLQHAEHYTRMLGEATREMAREQEQRQGQGQQNQGQGQNQGGQNANGNGSNGQNGNGQNGNGQNGNGQGGNAQGYSGHDRNDAGQDRQETRHIRPEEDEQPDFAPLGGAMVGSAVGSAVGAGADDGPGLVETPEMRHAAQADAPSAASGERPTGRNDRGPRGPRGPRKPRGDKPANEVAAAPVTDVSAAGDGAGEAAVKKPRRARKAPASDTPTET